MRASSLNRPVFLMAVALAAIQSLPAGPVQQADIETEGGVRIVRNPATPVKGPDGKVATVSLAEDLVIGNDTSREDYWFGFVNSLAVDGAGRIFTLDPKVVRIRAEAFDKQARDRLLEERAAILSALGAITGQNFGEDLGRWRAWLQKQK